MNLSDFTIIFFQVLGIISYLIFIPIFGWLLIEMSDRGGVDGLKFFKKNFSSMIGCYCAWDFKKWSYPPVTGYFLAMLLGSLAVFMLIAVGALLVALFQLLMILLNAYSISWENVLYAIASIIIVSIPLMVFRYFVAKRKEKNDIFEKMSS